MESRGGMGGRRHGRYRTNRDVGEERQEKKIEENGGEKNANERVKWRLYVGGERGG